jgi:hypothetical protein
VVLLEVVLSYKLFWFMIRDGAGDDNLFGYYTEWTRLSFVYMRVVFAVGFIAAWFLHNIHRRITSILAKVLEVEKG